ncbi:hypothetical protein NMG60_11013882 [Bertholletia excelsa]
MKRGISEDNPRENKGRSDGSGSINPRKKIMKGRNMKRLGGGGLSLVAFANAKTKSNHYNPALIKKQRQFYKNAKYISKYKKSVKQEIQQNDPHPAISSLQDQDETGKTVEINRKNKKNKKKSAPNLEELYKKRREEEEKSRIEREALIQAKKEERERAESRRKALKEKMLKKTKSGQPVMKYRIEHLLETLQGSTS